MKLVVKVLSLVWYSFMNPNCMLFGVNIGMMFTTQNYTATNVNLIWDR